MADEQNVVTQAQDTTPQVPTKATTAWNTMNYQQQQNFLQKNTGFDPSKYWMSLKSATPTQQKQPPTEDKTSTSLDTQTSPTKGVDLNVPPEDVTKTPDYANKESARLQEIQNNLSDYYQTQQNLFMDRNVFDKFFKYGERVQEQKDVLDTFYGQKEKERKIMAKTSDQIAKDGDNVDFLKTTDPNLYNEVMNKRNTISQQQDNTNTLLTLMKQFGFTDVDNNKIADQFETVNTVPQLTDTPEIAGTKTNIVNYTSQIAALDQQIEDIRKQVISQYPWVPDSQISAIVTDRTNKLIDQKNALIRQVNTSNDIIKNYQADQTNQLKQYELQQKQLQEKITNFQNMYGLYVQTPEGMAEKAMAEYKANNPDMDTGTPDQQRMALDNTLTSYYEKFWDIIQRSKNQVMNDVLAEAEQKGISVSQALKDNFISPLMSKSEYKAYLNKSMWLSSGWDKLNDSTLYNSNTWEFRSASGLNKNTTSADYVPYTPATKETQKTALDKYTTISDGSSGWECGSFVNDYLVSMWVGRIFTDPVDAKKAQKNSDTAKVWSIAIFDYTNNPNASDAQKKYGHVAIITAVNSDWTVDLKESNKAGEGKVFSRKNVPMSSIYGYFDPTQATTADDLIDVNPELANFYNRTMSSQAKDKLTTEERKTIDWMWISRQDFLKQATAWKAKQDKDVAKWVAPLIPLLQELGKINWVDLQNLRAWTPWTDGRQLRKNLKQILSSAALQKLIDLKSQGATFWALSDQELAFITDASSNIDIWAKQWAFQKNIKRMAELLTKGLQWTWVDIPSADEAEIDAVL